MAIQALALSVGPSAWELVVVVVEGALTLSSAWGRWTGKTERKCHHCCRSHRKERQVGSSGQEES